MSTERMPDPAALVPGAMRALTALTDAVNAAGLDRRLLALAHLRAGQVNGCGPCVAEGVRRAREHGATRDQLDTVAAWRETPWFSEDDRAALALTEAVTRLTGPDPVPDAVWDTAAKHFDQRELAVLLLNAAVANAVNRLDVAIRRQATAH